MRFALAFLICIAALHAQGSPSEAPRNGSAEKIQNAMSPGAVTLTRPDGNAGNRPQFLSVTLLPQHGLDIFQITADIPGIGEIPLIASPTLEEAATRMNARKQDAWSYVSYGMGGAILLPWASRISGEISADHRTVSTNWRSHALSLRINSSGKYAVHGLMEEANVTDIRTTKHGDDEILTGVLHAGDFGGQWPSKTDVKFTVILSAAAVEIKVEARNVGDEEEPMAIGWHPYFVLPSHDRSHARLQIAADRYAETVPSYGLTTGVLKLVSGTDFDFRNSEGARLPAASMNVNFSGMHRQGCVARLIDRSSSYGLCIRALSSAIHTVQVYSPKEASFVAIEPQFNLPDPLRSEWKKVNTGFAALAPGKSAVWHVRLELFRPAKKR